MSLVTQYEWPMLDHYTVLMELTVQETLENKFASLLNFWEKRKGERWIISNMKKSSFVFTSNIP